MKRKTRKLKEYPGDCRMDCGRKINHPSVDTCSTCYQYLYYWLRRGVKGILERQKKLALFNRRLDSISNVRSLEVARQKKRGR